MARLVVVSFRLGANDGVSVEARKWINALRKLGHDVTTLAGDGDADVLMPDLAIGATSSPSLDTLNQVIDNADLVIVENLASLPLNVPARDVLYQALDQRAAIFHHHDLPWQREQWRDEATPRDQDLWLHVTINDLSRRELEERGVSAVTIYNSFDCDPPLGRRHLTRHALGLENERLMLLPTRAIPRKNVAGALELATALDAVLWLLGPAEDGYGPTLANLLAESTVEVRRALPEGLTIHDAYAAADLVTLPSTWEGFGNPVLESVTHRRPLAVYPYPVLEEIRAFGFQFFDLDDVEGALEFLDSPDDERLRHNAEIARRHFNLDALPQRLATLMAVVGLT
ncbi:MAG TPA: glycosyltransferase family 4 protein [Acidimicrobiales bacterium]|nr:glycosyltransferase family 4 protein [Acidimicrobiales bacterium]